MAKLWLGTISILDAKGAHARAGVWLEGNYDLITDANRDPKEYMQELALQLDALIDGQIDAIKVSEDVPLPGGLKAAPLPIADVEQSLRMEFVTAIGSKPEISFPTWSEGYILPGGKLDESSPAVQDFIILLVSPEDTPGSYALGPSDNRGEPIIRFVDGEERFHPRKG